MAAEKDIKTKISLDTILKEEIGEFGWFQLRTSVLAVMIAMVVAWSSMGYLFTTARISTRCVIPECDSAQPEWAPYWLPNAIPATSQGSLDNCQRFGVSPAPQNLVASATCPATIFDRNIVQPCEEYVYENTYSVVYDFNLACDEWSRTIIGMTRTAGAVVGMPLAGYLSDRFGRRVVLCVTAFNTAWLGVVRYWAGTYVGFTVSGFLEAMLGAGCYTSAYILITELTGARYRAAAGAAMNLFYSVGSMSLGLIARAVPYWRNLTLILYIPQILTLSYFWLMPESIRWYMSKGRFEESDALLKKAAIVNGRQLSDKSLEALRRNVEEEARALDETRDEDWLVVTVFRHKRVLLRCIVAPVWWATSSFVSYGLSVNAVNMSGDIYLNFIAVSAVEIPAQFVSVYLLKKIGRKPVLIISFWMCAVCQIAYIFLPQGLYALSLTVYLISKFSMGMEVVALYVYTAELYPTVKRQSLFSFTSMVGRLGNVVAPLTPAFGAQWFAELPFVLFAGLACLAGALVFLTPETLGVKLPDTFEEAEAIGRDNKKTEK